MAQTGIVTASHLFNNCQGIDFDRFDHKQGMILHSSL